MKFIRLLISICIVAIALLCIAPAAQAFCGFYVAKADTSLYNQASEVAIARDGQRTVLTMANDYKGEVEDFALVVPVPVVLEEGQVNVGDPNIIKRLDGFSAPRLVEYFDSDPCVLNDMQLLQAPAADMALESRSRGARGSQALGVTVESSFSVGEYDIVILSATESDGLETWLQQNGYRIPNGASRLLQPYIRQGLKFFVAKVNLAEFEQSEFQSLRPLQIAYESPRFMLPIRLGMMNAETEQDLVVYLMSPRGQVELTNYRTVNIPSNEEIPVFVKQEFAEFYTALFENSHKQAGENVAFLEYAWNMGNCDPCAADPLSLEELRKAGVFWLDSGNNSGRWGGPNVFITRLHLRYTRDKFPEDLTFQETSNRQIFQGRYIVRHPFTGEAQCEAAQVYKEALPERFEQEAQNLARLTGWDINAIRQKLPAVQAEPRRWWQRLWNP